MDIDKLLLTLRIHKGGLAGLNKAAPANGAYYIDSETWCHECETDWTAVTNYDEQVAKFKIALEEYVDQAIEEAMWHVQVGQE